MTTSGRFTKMARETCFAAHDDSDDLPCGNCENIESALRRIDTEASWECANVICARSGR